MVTEGHHGDALVKVRRGGHTRRNAIGPDGRGLEVLAAWHAMAWRTLGWTAPRRRGGYRSCRTWAFEAWSGVGWGFPHLRPLRPRPHCCLMSSAPPRPDIRGLGDRDCGARREADLAGLAVLSAFRVRRGARAATCSGGRGEGAPHRETVSIATTAVRGGRGAARSSRGVGTACGNARSNGEHEQQEAHPADECDASRHVGLLCVFCRVALSLRYAWWLRRAASMWCAGGRPRTGRAGTKAA
jgi:hypothetical protein